MSSKESTPDNEKASSNQGATALATESRNIQARQIHPATIIQKARLDPRLLTPGDVLQLQRTIGNQAVGRLLAQKAQRQPIQKEENKTGLPDNLKSGIENLSGLPMDDVRVHYNSSEPPQVQALAYTQGTDIHVGPGQEKHLPHEAWHVVQQKQGRVLPTMQMKEVSINDDLSLEREADLMGAKAASVQDPLLMQRNSFLEHEFQGKQGQLGEATIQGVRPVIQSASMMGVVQRSSLPGEADQAAQQDEAIAGQMLNIAKAQIETFRETGESAPMEADVENPFDDLQIRGTAITLRRTVYITIDRGNGPEVFRVARGNLNGAIDICQHNGWPFQVQETRPGQPVQRVATVIGAMNENAAKPNAVPPPNAANATLNFTGVTARSTSLGMTTTDLHDQPAGTGVGATRPANWAQFIAMIGAINPFKQGHQLHQNLSGEGTHDNLAPFTPSINGLHYTRVESRVLNQTELTGRGQFADYDVTPNYAGNPGIVVWAQGRFAGMTPANQRAAMVNALIMTVGAAAAYAPAAPLSAPDLLVANTWIQNYVNTAFPTDIDCDATFIDAAGGGNFTGTNLQTVNITNDF